MGVTADVVSRVHKRVSRKTREETAMPRELTIKEIEKELGFDKVKPIAASPSDEQDMLEKGDCFKDWYEEELRRFYYENQ